MGVVTVGCEQGCVTQAEEPDVREKTLLALAWATEPQLIEDTLEAALGDAVRAQDTCQLIQAVADRGGKSLQAAWSFLRRCAHCLCDWAAAQ